MPGNYYIGIDVGTGSVRAGLVQDDGTLLASSTEATITYRDPHDHRIFEQSTNNIWDGMCKTIRAILALQRPTQHPPTARASASTSQAPSPSPI